ncbi:MAG: hypothetical protein MJZ89_05900 [Paludibacteraceae bacterium]|nr:hypothetical protein [Paludibacteraceae bacterium]
MKKIFNYSMLLITSMLLALTGCKKEELVFDHELPQFEIKSDAILLEVIMPSGTAADEEIFITGEFNNGEKYQLEKAKESDKKWGIYLYESDFAAGKTLKDGFTFVSAKNGAAYTVKGEPEQYTLDAAYGTRTNVWINRWESYFKTEDNPGEIVPGEYEHLYIIGNVDGTDWKPAEPLEFEMVGTDIFRGEFTFPNETSYFAILTAKGENNDDWATVNAARWGASDALLTEGTVLDLKLQDGSDQCVTIAAGTYTITVNMAAKQIVIGKGNWDKPEKPGKYEHLYILGNIEGTGWTPAEPLELKKVGRDLFRGEFTFVPDGSNEICYFAFATEKGASNDDWATLNASRWGGGELKEGEYLPLTLQTTSDVTVTIAPGTYTITVNMIFNEAVIGDGDWSGREEPADEPEDPEEPTGHDTIYVSVKDTITTHLYFAKATESMVALYAWGTSELFGGWPGAIWTDWKTASFLGQTFYHYEFDAEYGSSYNLIFNNNNGGVQYNAFTVNVGARTEYFYTVQDDQAVDMLPSTEQAAAIRRLFGK